MYSYELGSYTVHSSTIYSDGKAECSPPVFPDSQISICPACRKGFWTDDARIPENEDSPNENDDLPNAKDVYDIDISRTEDFPLGIVEYYVKFLEEYKEMNMEKEILLRINIWRLLNDRERFSGGFDFRNFLRRNGQELLSRIKGTYKKSSGSVKRNRIFSNNLKRLTAVFQPENEEEKLLLVEMHRELGQFRQASRLLKSIDKTGNQSFHRKLKSAIRKRRSKVMPLN